MNKLRELFVGKEVRAIILSLDAAGKTTLLYKMKVCFTFSSFVNDRTFNKAISNC